MSSNIKITYINKSMNKDLPKVFLFLKNEIPTFDCLKEGVAWKVIEDVGRESSCRFVFPIETEVRASWDNCNCDTRALLSESGKRYTVRKGETGIALEEDGNAEYTRSIEFCNNIKVENEISVNMIKDGRTILTKRRVGYGQKASFVLHPRIYWGIASEIKEGMELCEAQLHSDNFFELDLEGVSSVTVALYGNELVGYQFRVEDQE